MGWQHSQRSQCWGFEKGAEGSRFWARSSPVSKGSLAKAIIFPGSFSDSLNNNPNCLSTLTAAQECRLLPAQAEPTLTSVFLEYRCHAHKSFSFSFFLSGLKKKKIHPLFIYLPIYCVCVRMCVYLLATRQAEIRGQLVEFSSLLPLCGAPV